jgi:uncharacterized protein with ParB-like and HNH nuclease domain
MAKTDITVGQLVDMIERGELRLPELQRRYVWPATRIRDLLDSLYRGYLPGRSWYGTPIKTSHREIWR